METTQPLWRDVMENSAPLNNSSQHYDGPIRPMRNRISTTAAQSRHRSIVPPAAVVALNRLGYGPRPGDIDEFQALGSSDQERLTRYLDQQIDHETLDDDVYAAKLADLNLATHNKSLTELWADHAYADSWQKVIQPLSELTTTHFLRAIHSKKQLLEVMTDFWHNHFNIFGWDWPAAVVMPQTNRIIRDSAFGNFRTLLEQVSASTAMLFYLDNVYSDAEGPNENFARELLELHTLGAEAYYGVVPRHSVPGYPSAPAGFVDADVVDVARCLTGWSVRYQSWDLNVGSTGEFMYRAEWHDDGAKIVLGQQLPANQPALKDGRDVFDLIARHPATAKHICTKLCRRLIGDQPPPDLVAVATDLFLLHADKPDQIGRVVRHIVLSAEFRSTWGSKIKRPLHAAVSALRATDATFDIGRDQTESNVFLWFYAQSGHYPFNWHPPNGYPDVQGFWAATGTLLMRWRMLSWLPHWVSDNDKRYYADILGQTPASLTTPTEYVDFWIERIFGYAIHPDSRQILIDMMAQGRNPNFALPPIQDNESIQHRLRSLVGTMLMSPEFQQR